MWAGRTVSVFGTRLDALTYCAVITTAASPAQLGWLGALTGAPILLLSLSAGASVDRLRRRPLMIAADLGRALLMGSIPLAALLGGLTLAHVFMVAILSGALGLIFEIADHAYFPTLVTRGKLVEGNSKLEAGAEVAELAAPAAGGALVQALTAPLAVLVDAATFLDSAASILAIRARERAPAPRPRTGKNAGIWAGVVLLLRHPILRALTLSETMRSFFGAGFLGTLYTYFALKELHLAPVTVGLVIGTGGLGGLAGALLVGKATLRLGPGPALISAGLLEAVVLPLTPLAGGPLTLVMAMMVTAQFMGDFFGAAREITAVSVRQSLVPGRLLGRVAAGSKLVVGGAAPLGALAAGAVATAFSARAALFAAVAGIALSNLWLIFSPLRDLRAMPARARA